MPKARETLEVDVLFVEAGPAGLSGAIHLKDLVRQHNQEIQSGRKSGKLLEDPSVLVIEKGKEVGAHSLSGAVLDPRGLSELVGDFLKEGAPLDRKVVADDFYFLTERGKIRAPIVPPPLRNHGNYIISLNKLVRWLAARAEAAGVEVLPGFPGAETLYQDDRVAGVRVRDQGLDREGKPKSNFEPGVDIRARVTVLSEGTHGSLAKQVINRLKLQGREPQVWALGVKELWEAPDGRTQPGRVIHTMGYPLRSDTFGGGWIYSMERNLVSLGLVVGLDYPDPLLDPHREFQRFKLHPLVRTILEGGKLLRYGAKTVPEGGYYAMPRPYADGLLLIGDTAGFLNAMRLKGVHLAMKSGMLAAETILDGLLQDDFSSRTLSGFETRFRSSWAHQELWKVRNFHAGFKHGLFWGLIQSGLQLVSGGRGLVDPLPSVAGHQRLRQVAGYHGRPDARPAPMRFDGQLSFDKLTDVYNSGTLHEENQPVHLVVADTNLCSTRCLAEYGNPCQYFCPAAVYEMVARDGGGLRLQINAANCVHCKTCDIMDPYQIINWVTPEGGGGPDYQGL